MGKAGSNGLFFDKRDHVLIHIVNSVYDGEHELGYTRKLYYTFFHPLGIKELAESKGLRMAYSIVSLLASMERGNIENRIQALNGLRDDILTTADGPMPKNTSRVLLQIMKDLVRAKGNDRRQLELAHDFRMAAFGKPRVIRKFLTHYHLLEMPEEWNQIAFDDHVHDANTSGRKSPTHLIMDAWIKGLRRLRVIYYHYIEPRFTAELIQAAAIMDIDLRIGIEFRARFRGRYISFIWVSRGFPDVESFLCFLAESRVVRFMEKGKAIVRFQEKYTLSLMEDFNDTRRKDLCRDLGVDLPPLAPRAFLDFLYPGQPSALYLAEYIHGLVLGAAKDKIRTWNAQPARDPQEQKQRDAFISRMETFSVGSIISDYLESSPFFDIFQNTILCASGEIPDRLKMDFKQVLEEVCQLHHSFRITLNLGNLEPEDVIELIYDGKGLITRLETINLKNFITQKTDHLTAINALQQAINDGSLLKLKMMVRQISQGVRSSDYPDKEDRLRKLTEILYDIDALKAMYAVRPLKSRIGSDSTGKPSRSHGMGFALINTLPRRVAGQIRNKTLDMRILPARIRVSKRTTIPEADRLPLLQHLPGLRHLVIREKTDWVFDSFALEMEKAGNIVSLGRVFRQIRNDLGTEDREHKKKNRAGSWKNLNTKLKNSLKILMGFVPAFLCFATTKEWWLLAYLGAFIWFGITGVRNILQSVIGGGGIRRTSLLKWNDFVSWDRLSDSLLFTGFSVPLLDWVVKTLVLEKGMGVTMATSPAILYTVMALANGIYLFSHNMFRGLPKSAATGNLFRSIFSIPVAILFSSGISAMLTIFGVPAVDAVLQKWAAIISKGASDCVAGIIEGAAERYHNIKLRERDIQMKFSDLFGTYSRLAQLFPENEELRILETSSALIRSKNSEVRDLMTMITINCLDLLYFWMYLPRAKAVMIDMFGKLTPDEKTIFRQAQKLLSQERYVSRLFIDGILGENFSRPLSFYLTTHKPYLSQIMEISSQEQLSGKASSKE